MKFDSERMRLYLDFVEARHNVWIERQVGAPAPWTSDPILASKKFTNVFRVLDPGSQFVLTDLVEENGSARDTLMRLFLYRHTGRVEAWEHMRGELGYLLLHWDLDTVLEYWRDYRAEGNPIFTGAYLVYPGSSTSGTDKLDYIIGLTQRLFTPGSPEDVVPDFLKATTQAERFGVLRRNRGVADFMSMQILTDWGYTPFGLDVENDFVVPGPGCRKGIMAITDTPDQLSFLHFARAEVLMGDDVPVLNLPGGGSRVPSIMDVQNTLCEFSKYVRYLSKGSAAKPYLPAHPGPQPEPVLPAHWETTTTR